MLLKISKEGIIAPFKLGLRTFGYGTLIKMVYFSRHGDPLVDDKQKRSLKEGLEVSNGSNRSYPVKGGCLHFLKFDTRKINECLDFIDSKQLHRGGNYWRSFSEAASKNNAVIKATGGGAYMYANLFKERLGVNLDKEDEMDSLVAGANFLLKAIHHEAFTHMDGQKEFVQIDENDLFPYLLVNIGSGVSIIKVDGNGSFQRVDGTHAGGELSQRGDNKLIDLLVGDIDGKMDYSKIGLSASTIASSFGKVVPEKRKLKDYCHEDISSFMKGRQCHYRFCNFVFFLFCCKILLVLVTQLALASIMMSTVPGMAKLQSSR
ncbi:hypothetical protein C5167_016591 [Papaver somniferum]|nr:hypothetical protein C5167_016591 [Papaver somniferum]